jgi:hypothetical protein
MTIWVWRDGQLVEKPKSPVKPYRFEAYESPINGATITSPRQRERDLNNSGSIDPRDLPKDHQWSKGRAAQREDDAAGSTGQQQFDF